MIDNNLGYSTTNLHNHSCTRLRTHVYKCRLQITDTFQVIQFVLKLDYVYFYYPIKQVGEKQQFIITNIQLAITAIRRGLVVRVLNA